MGDNTFTGAPFLTQRKRFDIMGVHPSMLRPGLQPERNAVKGTGVTGRHTGRDPKDEIDKHLIKRPGPWKRALETFRLAKMPHLLYRGKHAERALLKQKIGPGSYEYKDFVKEDGIKPRSKRGICDTTDKRFKDSQATTAFTPGPGTYGKNGIACEAYEKKCKTPKGNITIMDGTTGCRDLPEVGCHLGPGTYNPYKSSVQENQERVVSLRGPYDLFTDERSKPIATGHRIIPMQKTWPGQYEVKTFADEIADKKGKGRFSRRKDQFPGLGDGIFCQTLSQCPKNPDHPGPGAHDVRLPSTKPGSQKPCAFLSTSRRDDRRSQQFFNGHMTNILGPGRYDASRWERFQNKNGHSSVFESNLSQDLKMEDMVLLRGRYRGNATRNQHQSHVQFEKKSRQFMLQ